MVLEFYHVNAHVHSRVFIVPETINKGKQDFVIVALNTTSAEAQAIALA